MRFRLAHWGMATLPILGIAVAAHAQSPQPSEQRLDQVERRLDQIQQQYQAELKARDQEIARLREELNIVRKGQQPAGAAAKRPEASTLSDQITRSRDDILKEIQEDRPAEPTLRTPANFNPDFAVVTDYRANVSSENDNPARNRFDVGSVELDLRAAVDPRADAVAILPVVREVEDPLFFDEDDIEEGSNEVNVAIELEEAYLFLHDFGVPNLTAKLGRFHLRFGRQNILHAHDWPTVDNNFVSQSFLGPEALTDSGLSLSYVIPPALIGDQYVEVIGELITGEGGEEAPVLNNDAFVDSPAFNLHALWNHDIARDWNVEVGTSWLRGQHNNDNRQDANLFGADLTLIHTDPTGRFNNTLLQAEAVYGDVDTSRDENQNAFGVYLLGQQQLNRDWYVGCRLDWTENALDDQQEVWGVTPYASWYWSEFLRFRLEYQHKDGDVTSDDTLYFQATWIFGAHPPHPYWAMR